VTFGLICMYKLQRYYQDKLGAEHLGAKYHLSECQVGHH